MGLVDVIIPTYNRADRIEKAVRSVLGQTFRDFELTVVDDGSVDGTQAVLEKYEGALRVIRHERNKGVSAARNSGCNASDAPFIAFLDSDDQWLPGKMEAQVNFFRENPEALVCQTQEIWVRGGKRVNPGKKHLKPSGDIFEASLERCLVSPSAVMLRRALLEEVGTFNEHYPVCEDYDLWLRIACRHPIHLIDEYHLIREGGHGDQLSSSMSGMDRFRIASIVRLIESGKLSDSQMSACLGVLEKKCGVYSQGCIKRGRLGEGRLIADIPRRMKEIAGRA